MSDVMDASAARALTDRAKIDAEKLWVTFLDLYRGEAHTALGYSSWADYCKAEFDVGRSRAYELLNAARVAEALRESAMADLPRPRNERVARELGSFGDDLEAMRETWSEAVEQHGPEPTAAEVRDIREARSAKAAPSPAPEPQGDPEKDFRFQVLEDVVELLEQVSEPETVVLPTDPGDVEALDEAIRFLADWTPRMVKAWREHKRALRRRAA